MLTKINKFWPIERDDTFYFFSDKGRITYYDSRGRVIFNKSLIKYYENYNKLLEQFKEYVKLKLNEINVTCFNYFNSQFIFDFNKKYFKENINEFILLIEKRDECSQYNVYLMHETSKKFKRLCEFWRNELTLSDYFKIKDIFFQYKAVKNFDNPVFVRSQEEAAVYFEVEEDEEDDFDDIDFDGEEE